MNILVFVLENNEDNPRIIRTEKKTFSCFDDAAQYCDESSNENEVYCCVSMFDPETTPVKEVIYG